MGEFTTSELDPGILKRICHYDVKIKEQCRAGISTWGLGGVDQLPGYKFTTHYLNANYRIYK